MGTMTRRLRAGGIIAAMTWAALATLPGAAAAQGGATKAPDITGSWQRYGSQIGARAAGPNDPLLPPPNPPPPLRSQYLKEWQARTQAIREADARGEPLASNVTHCIPEGMPAMMGATFPMEILQSRGQVTIIEEAYTQVRRVLLDRPLKPLDEVEPSFYGHSVGRWEGDTLVIDTIGIKETVRYQNVPHSKDLRIRERIRLVSADIIWNEITMEDPAILEKPWTIRFAYRRMPDYTLLEYICEDNREYADEQGRQKMRLNPR
jgi:hypothetical protein